jgi:hypothetical protein
MDILEASSDELVKELYLRQEKDGYKKQENIHCSMVKIPKICYINGTKGPCVYYGLIQFEKKYYAIIKPSIGINSNITNEEPFLQDAKDVTIIGEVGKTLTTTRSGYGMHFSCKDTWFGWEGFC